MNQQRCPDFAALLRRGTADAGVHALIADCFYEELGRVARHLCRDTVLAEDAVQEAMALSLRSLDTYRGDAPLQHWLRRLVVTACSRLRRGHKNDPRRHVALEEDGAVPQGPSTPASAEMDLLLTERLTLLAEALAEVPEPNRSLILRHEGEEVPLSALAEEFGLTVEGVKARLKRTRAQLRRALEERAEASV